MSNREKNPERTVASTEHGLSSLVADSGIVSYYSALTATGVAISAVVWIAIAMEMLFGAVFSIALGVLLAVGIATIGTDELLKTIGGGILVLTTLTMFVGLILAVYELNPLPSGLALSGFLIGLGVARFRLDAFGNGALSRTTRFVLRVAITVGLISLFVLLGGIDLSVLTTSDTSSAISQLLSPTTDAGATTGFVVVSWLAVAGVWLVGTALPPMETFPTSTQAVYQTIRSRVVIGAVAILGGGSILLVVVYSIGLETPFIGGLIELTVGTLLQSQLLRTMLLRLALSSIVVTVLIFIGRAVGIEALVSDVPWSRAPAAITVGGFLLIVLAADPAIETVQSSLLLPSQIETAITVIGSTAAGLFGSFLLLVTLAIGLAVIPIVSGVGLLPASTAGPRLVVSGLILAGTVGVAADTSTYAIFGVYVAAIVVWNITSYGVEVTTELGYPASHRNGELIHAAAALSVGVIAFVVSVVGYRLINTISVAGDPVLLVITITSVVVIILTGLLFVPRQKFEVLVQKLKIDR